jgi:GAF domain-containing protein
MRCATISGSRLDFRFNEERTFDQEELEIARALGTQASLADARTRPKQIESAVSGKASS